MAGARAFFSELAAIRRNVNGNSEVRGAAWQSKNPKQGRSGDGEFGPFLLGALLGGVIGAVAAFWFAPQSGAETRQEIEERGNELREEIGQVATEARRRVEGESIEESMRAGKVRQGVSKRLFN